MKLQEEEWDLTCPKHGEKIISVQVSDTGDNQMFCLKCLTEKQMPLQQLAQQLTNLRQKKIQNLIEQGINSEKRLFLLKKRLLTMKELFNQQTENIIQKINDEINSMNLNIQKETDWLQQPIQQLNLTQVNNHLQELKKQSQNKEDLGEKKYEQLNKMIIQEFIELVEQMNNLIYQGSDWMKESDDLKKQIIQQKITNEPELNKLEFTQYQTFIQETEIIGCWAMTMDKEEKTLINGQFNNIQIWDMNSDGTISFKQTLNGHTNNINCLCFSQNGYWFISGSRDQTIRIWKKNGNDDWISQQIIKDAHNDWVQQIVLTNEDDQLISCSRDETIKVWMIKEDDKQWECIQILTDHTNQVLYLSFSPTLNVLASSGKDKLRIWQRGKDKLWKNKQVIENPINDKILRIEFITNNEFIVSTQYQGKLLRYALNNKGFFQFKSDLQLNEMGEQQHSCFPIIYNNQQRLIILRLSNNYIYILKYQQSGEFSICQVLHGDFTAGYIFKDGNRIILYDLCKSCIQVLKQ